MVGDVIFYRKNGEVERIEHYDMLTYSYEKLQKSRHDGPGPEGTWKWYDKRGRIVKTVEYTMTLTFDKSTLKPQTITKLYDKKGNVLSEIKSFN